MEKILFIRDNIKNNNISHQYILYFINIHDIKYSENKNGIFINLSKLDTSVIDKLYEYIVNYNDMEYDKHILIDLYKNNINVTEPVIKKIYKKNKMLTPVENKIIKLSKDI